MSKNRIMIVSMLIIIVSVCILIIRERSGEGQDYSIREEAPIEEVKNAWILEAKNDTIIVLDGREHVTYECRGVNQLVREQVADLKIQAGVVIEISIKNHKINGTVASQSEGMIDVQGYGILPKSDDMRSYQLYDDTCEVNPNQIAIGYDYTDFVIEDGVIVAALLVRNQPMEEIRVLLKSSGYVSDVHHELTFLPHDSYTIHSGEQEWNMQSGELLSLEQGSSYFVEDTITIEPNVQTAKMEIPSITRAQEKALYRGAFTIRKVDGGLVIVNELPLEEYLYAVVPSEMPASYPMEALKAQAICARTYAYHSMEVAGIPEYGAHVDDSTGYQVYQNNAEYEETTRAVKETQGMMLYYGDQLADTFYYSTSCGYGSDTRVWNDNGMEQYPYIQSQSMANTANKPSSEEMIEEAVFQDYIDSVHQGDYEKEERYYRWSYGVEEVASDVMLEKMQTRSAVVPQHITVTEVKSGKIVEVNQIQSIGKIVQIEVVERFHGGIINELVITTSKYQVVVAKEYNIRYILGNQDAILYNVKGERMQTTTIVPSAFFYVELERNDDMVTAYTLQGGGYGHGAGMSQNAAKEMALAGLEAKEILTFFFQRTTVGQE